MCCKYNIFTCSSFFVIRSISNDHIDWYTLMILIYIIITYGNTWLLCCYCMHFLFTNFVDSFELHILKHKWEQCTCRKVFA